MKCPREYARAVALDKQIRTHVRAHPPGTAGRNAIMAAAAQIGWAKDAADEGYYGHCLTARRHLRRTRALLAAARRFAKYDQNDLRRRPRRQPHELRWY